MSYSSYNAYLVQNNGAIILSMLFLNYFASKFNIYLLNALLDQLLVKFLESLLTFVCLFHIWYATREITDPYVANLDIPFKEFIFTPGPLVSAIYRVYQFITSEFINKSTKLTVTPAFATQSLSNKTEPFLNRFLTGQQPEQLVPAYNFGRLELSNQPIVLGQPENTFRPESALGLGLTQTPTDTATPANMIPKLRYTPCIKPPLKPSAHRERSLWFLAPTPEIIEDFRIEQMIGFQKNWTRFNDSLSHHYYNNLYSALLQNIFLPLIKSIDAYDAWLAPHKQSIAQCNPRTVALSLILPDLKSDNQFNISECVTFTTVDGWRDTQSQQYVIDRIRALAANSKLAGFRYIPEDDMPTDTKIIMHALKIYLDIKEPHVIPPLVKEEGDLFKFLLIYFYLTPELDHWKIFQIDAPKLN